MGIRLSKMFQRNPPPSHDDVATFLSGFLTPHPRPRDVEYFYHVPPQYMRPRPRPPPITPGPVAAPLAGVVNTAADSTSSDTANIQSNTGDELEQRQPPKNKTQVSHITFSITPTPGVYTSLLALSPRSTAPVAFIHRPWSLERWKVPRGTTVLSSHTGFDETLTVGWNVKLAGRLGVDVGEGRQERIGDKESARGIEEGWRCICLKGYKGDEERRIGLVGGFGMHEENKRVGIEAGEAREERGDEDVDGGVKLDVGGEKKEAGTKGPRSVLLKDMLARIEHEFAGTGEVFQFSPDSNSQAMTIKEDDLRSVPASVDGNTLIAPMTHTETTDTTLSPAITRKPPKRQKKMPAPPPPPLPPSISLVDACADLSTPDKPVTAVAIMNAFHPEEVERAVSAAYAGEWITWKPVGLPQDSKDVETSSVTAAQVPPSGEMIPDLDNATTNPRAPSAETYVPISRRDEDQMASQGNVLMLTGAPRAPGIAHVQTHYAGKVTVVCVGHEACEEWGIRFLAQECRQKWPGMDVREVFEEEVVVPREKKEKRQVVTGVSKEL